MSRLAAALVGTLLASHALAADGGTGGIAYETKSTRVVADAFGRQSTTNFRQRVYARSDAFRTDNLDTGEITIVLLDTGRMIKLDPTARTYTEITFDEVRAFVEGHRKILERKLKDPRTRLSRSQRRRIEVILGRRKARLTINRSRRKVDILGHKCTKITYREEGVTRIEEWVTQDIQRTIDMTRLLEITGDFSPELLAAKKLEKGFPLKSVVHGRLAITPVKTSNEVTAIESKPLGNDLFAIPSGYQKAGAPARSEPPDEGPEPAPEELR